MAATLTPKTTASTQARGGGGRGDSAEEENDNMSSSSSFASTSFRSISSSSSSLSSYTTSSSTLTHKPHKSHQADWEAIRCLRAAAGRVSLDHFRIVRRLGSGDLGNVYLCRLREPRLSAFLYAMKVVDRDSLAARKKLQRAETEREILSVLDHPFLPTLYAHFDAAHYSCIVMEFCPGGDLHVARQRQPSRRFSLSSTRFYAAEILVALEYLHMMGVVYRDLKPENVLVRGDGHIMLSDFDLSLKCDVVPKLLKPPDKSSNHKACSSSSSSSCSVAAHGQPVMSCFLGTGSCRIMRTRSRTITMTANESNPTQKPIASKKDEKEEEEDALEGELLKVEPELVVEPIQARSKSFVGTHEYLAPEVISGLGHGSAVDWWTLGVFMYELLFGRTPFKGDGNERTLINIIKQPLRFPKVTVASGGDVEGMVWAQDLISKLLVKNPKKRIGSVRGAVEIKKHEFFKGVNWALIRSVEPPEVPNDGLHRREYISKLINRCDPNNGHHFDYF